MKKHLVLITLLLASSAAFAEEAPLENHNPNFMKKEMIERIKDDTIEGLAITMYSKSVCRSNIDHRRKDLSLERYTDMSMSEAFYKAENRFSVMKQNPTEHPCSEISKRLSEIGSKYEIPNR